MKNKILTALIGFVIFFLLLTICFGIGYKRGKNSIEIQRDTVWIEKTITEYKPSYTLERPIEFQKFKIPTYLFFTESNDSSVTIKFLQDSLDIFKHLTDSLEIELQRVQRYYAADDYEAWVSGIDPVLDSIKVKQQIQQIINTHVEKGDVFSLNAGLKASGWNKEACSVSPNINVSYIRKRVTFTGEVGFQVPLNNTAGTVPYWQIGINYSFWSF